MPRVGQNSALSFFVYILRALLKGIIRGSAAKGSRLGVESFPLVLGAPARSRSFLAAFVQEYPVQGGGDAGFGGQL